MFSFKEKEAFGLHRLPNRVLDTRVQGKAKTMVTYDPQEVGSARLMKRHYALIISLFTVVLLPTILTSAYMFLIAKDQYSSKLSFSVRSSDAGSSPLMLLGMPQLTGTTTADTDILYQYLRSQRVVEQVNNKIGLKSIYASEGGDFFFSLSPNASIEEMVNFWNRMVRVVLDTRTGIISVEVLSFNPHQSQSLAVAIEKLATDLLNQLSVAARADATKYAKHDLDKALRRLVDARTNLTLFRNKTRLIDPSSTLQTQIGLLELLSQKLVDAEIELALLLDELSKNDPRVERAEKKTITIRERLEDEKTKLGSQPNVETNYAEIVSEYESLTVEKEYAEQQYVSALAAMDAAAAEAQRQTRYLASHIEPTLAQEATHPKRLITTLLVFIISLLFWSLFVLVFYSARDRQS